MHLSVNYSMALPLSGSGQRSARLRQNKYTDASKIASAWSRIAQGFWKGNKDAEYYFNAHIDQLFSIRIQSINWQNDNPQGATHNLDFLVDKQDTLDASKALLFDNLLFAIRVTTRMLREMDENSNIQIPSPAVRKRKLGPKQKVSEQLTNQIARQVSLQELKLPDMNFSQYVGMVSLSVPNSILQPIVDLLTASLRIEFSLNVTHVLQTENLTPKSAKIEDLATFTAVAGQDFGAIAREMRPKRPSLRYSGNELNNDIFEENQLLAELDIQTLSDL